MSVKCCLSRNGDYIWTQTVRTIAEKLDQPTVFWASLISPGEASSLRNWAIFSWFTSTHLWIKFIRFFRISSSCNGTFEFISTWSEIKYDIRLKMVGRGSFFFCLEQLRATIRALFLGARKQRKGHSRGGWKKEKSQLSLRLHEWGMPFFVP